MPKRPYPYDDFSPLQFKTHIGVKELAAGSRQEELMKDVYEKTFEKLFSGVRNSSDVNDNHTQVMSTPAVCPLDATSRFEPMQTLLDGTGYLVPPMGINKPSPPPKRCEGFSGLVDFGSTTAALRNHVPAASLPAVSGQLCLDSSGRLTAPAPSAMDCDGDPGMTSKSAQSHASQGAAGAGGGLHRFGFKSTKPACQEVRAAQTQVCGTCGCLRGRRCCQFCERKVCHSCIRQCDLCSEYFCQLCSTINYDAVMERVFCLGCAG